MESIFMLIVLSLIMVIQFYTITMMPINSNKQLLLGCVVTEEIRNNNETKSMIKRFIYSNAAIMIISELILIYACLINNEVIIISSVFLAIIGSSISFGYFNGEMKKIKKILGGLKGKKQVTVFEIEKYKSM